jgi:hypothetical protein
MTMKRQWRISLGGLAVTLACASVSFAQEPTPSSPPASAGVPADSQDGPTVPVTPRDLERIRRALGTDPAVRINDDQLRFYMQILAKQPSFAEFAKGYDFKDGPTRRGNPMSHSEFLAIVTPRELNSQIGIDARETLEFALTNWLAQSLVRKAFEDLQKAKTEREIQDVRDRIERELQQLKSASDR